MADTDCRPAIKEMAECIAKYDIVYVGFPIWWGREPSVVDTFLTRGDFKGKRLGGDVSEEDLKLWTAGL